MSETGTIIALVADAEELAVWEPIFTRLEEKLLLVEMIEIPGVIANLRKRGASVSLVMISTRVYPLGYPKLVSQARQLFPDADIMLMCLSTDPPPPLSPLLVDNIRHLLINPVGGPFYDLDRVVSLFNLSIRRLKNSIPSLLSSDFPPSVTKNLFSQHNRGDPM
jgi:hypothetical protein